METLLVLSALVCVIIAAPAVPERAFQDFLSTTRSPLISVSREKKSPQQSTDFNTFSDGGTSFTNGQDVESDSPVERNVGFKRPIIVKKKIGYHLYRDSDEEKELSNSRESCNEEVKVKLCDEKLLPNSMSLKSTTVEDINDHSMSRDEMKRSLIMAKEAIANLERDMKKKDMQVIEARSDDTGIDEALHKDIDTARQALQHINENFENLESLSFRSTTLKNAEEMQDIHLTVAKSEEERIAQWMDVVENIQRNIDIARNIEDSFKNAPSSVPFEAFVNPDNDNMMATDTAKTLINNNDQQSTTENTIEQDMQCSSQVIKIKPKVKEANENDDLVDDLSSSATKIQESQDSLMRSDNLENSDKEQTSQLTNISPSEKLNNKNTLFNTLKTDQSNTFSPNDQPMHMISVEDKSVEETHISNDNLEADMDTASSNNEISMQVRSDLEKLKDHDLLTNSAASLHNFNKDNTNFDENTASLFVNSQGNNIDKMQQSIELGDRFQREGELIRTLPINAQSFDHSAMEKPFHLQRQTQAIDEPVKNSDLIMEPNKQSLTTASKSRGTESTPVLQPAETSNMHPQQNSELSVMQWVQPGMTNFDRAIVAKEAEKFSNQKELTAETRFKNPIQTIATMKSSKDFEEEEHPHHHNHHNHMRPEHIRKHHDHRGMSFDSEKENFEWNPSHEFGRSAYGPTVVPASPSTGSAVNAVGLFPNANIGPCSIPLLLSCAPSVTSGNLAKALPAGYGASAYRSEDAFTFFPNKRQVKKTKEMPSAFPNKIPST